jgi:hypothetical protein
MHSDRPLRVCRRLIGFDANPGFVGGLGDDAARAVMITASSAVFGRFAGQVVRLSGIVVRAVPICSYAVAKGRASRR